MTEAAAYDEAAIDLIAARLPELVHPGDGTHGPTPIPMPMFRNTGIPPEMAAQFAAEAGLPTGRDVARLAAEAIVHVLKTDGEIEFISKAELARLRAAEAVQPQHRQPKVHCNLPGCDSPLFRINVDTEHPTVNGPNFIAAVSSLNPNCPHKPMEQR